MRVHIRAGLAAVVLAASVASAQTVVQIDARGVFNADVILNDGTGVLDPTQDPIDLGLMGSDNFCFPTDSAAIRLYPASPGGVPNDAHFAADAFHPDVALWWNNADDGLNARRNAAALDRFAMDIPPDNYSYVHVFATSGDMSSNVTAYLEYQDGSIDTFPFVVPDWFDDPIVTPDLYYLIDGRDRVQVGSGPGVAFQYEDRDDAAIFGFRFAARPASTLIRLTLERTNTTGVFDFFGAVAETVAAPPTMSLYESRQPMGLLAPANVVATGVTSPFPWTAPTPVPLLCYFVDDGAGDPGLIYVGKRAGQIVFTF